MSVLTPRDYQLRAVDEVSRRLMENCIVTIPTGGGKTFVAALLIQQLGMRTLWIAHRRELISQAAQRLTACGLTCGVIAAGYPERRSAQVQVASVQTLIRRAMPPVDLIVIDEAHHARAGQYRQVLDNYPGVPVIGLTATPFRLDGKGLGDVGFGAIVVAAYPDELVAQGALVEPIVYAPDVPDLAGVRMHHGDYSERGLGDALDKPKLVGNIIETWQKLANGRKTVVFAINVEHSQHIVSEFQRAGVKAEHLDGSMSLVQRDAVLHRLRIGYTTVVSQCMVLTEGFDLPALEVATLARPTASLCLHLQQIGRICRAAPDKTGATVLDHAGNHLRHGTMTQRIEYSLDDVERAKKRDREAGEPVMKRCPKCFLLVPPATRRCKCGHEWEPAAAQVQTVEGELKLFTGTAPAKPLNGKLVARLRELIAEGRRRGYKPGWAKFMWKNEFHRFPNASEWAEAETVLRTTTATQSTRGWYRGGTEAHLFRGAGKPLSLCRQVEKDDTWSFESSTENPASFCFACEWKLLTTGWVG